MSFCAFLMINIYTKVEMRNNKTSACHLAFFWLEELNFFDVFKRIFLHLLIELLPQPPNYVEMAVFQSAFHPVYVVNHQRLKITQQPPPLTPGSAPKSNMLV